jgi:murein L,D-transpeptidase YafK
MKRLFYTFLCLTCLFASCREDRVAKAYAEKQYGLKAAFQAKNLTFPSPILIQVFKIENELDVWVNDSNQYKLFKTYKICKISGVSGRKLKEGDKQVPEGFYFIEKFNPQSDYHLSLGINYPNDVDKVVTDKDNPGGQIYIHGGCVSVGCMAMTDEQIKEIYLLALEGQKLGETNIPVNIYPFRMTDAQFNRFTSTFPHLLPFWQSLKLGHDAFDKTHVWVAPDMVNGQYLFH